MAQALLSHYGVWLLEKVRSLDITLRRPMMARYASFLFSSPTSAASSDTRVAGTASETFGDIFPLTSSQFRTVSICLPLPFSPETLPRSCSPSSPRSSQPSSKPLISVDVAQIRVTALQGVRGESFGLSHPSLRSSIGTTQILSAKLTMATRLRSLATIRSSH